MNRRGFLSATASTAASLLTAGCPAYAVESASNQQSLAEASALYESGDFTRAELFASEAVETAARKWGDDHPEWAQAATVLAEIRWQLSKPSEAEPLYRRALAIFESDGGLSDIRVARTLRGLALLYSGEDRKDEALALLGAALTIAESQKDPDILFVAGILREQGSVNHEAGRDEQALVLLKQAKRLVEDKFGADHLAAVKCDDGLAAVYYEKAGEHEAAIALVLHGLAIRERTLGLYHPDVAKSLNLLGGFYFGQDRFADALPLWTRSLDIRLRSFGPFSRRVSAQHAMIGMLHSSMGELDAALESYRAAAEILASREVLDRQGSRWTTEIDDGARMILRGLTSVAWQVAAARPSEKAALGAETFNYSQWLDTSRSAFSLAQMAARLRGGSDPSRFVRGSQFLIRSRLETEMALTGALVARPRNENRIARLRETLIKIDKLQARYGKLKAEMETTTLAVLRQALKPLSEELDLSSGLAGPKPADVTEVQAVLRADEAMVRYLVKGDETFAWAVTKDELRWERIALGSGELAADVAAFRRGLDPSGKDRSAKRIGPPRSGGFDLGRAYALYRTVWAPLAGSLAGKVHVLVALSGPLTALPLQALVTAPPDPATGKDGLPAYRDARWLVRDHAVSVLPFAAALPLLRSLPERAHAKEPFLGIGDPAFGSCRDSEPAGATEFEALAYADAFRGVLPDAAALCRLVPLPETRGELQEAAAELGAGPDDLLLGEAATESAIKKMSSDGTLARRRVLMFATHGLVAGDIAGFAEPGLALARPDRPENAGDNGYLSASEISNLQLNAEWVILSACNTAAGAAPGAEALSGVASSFMYAGARALLVSHWAVYSDAAAMLTTRTFKAMRADPTLHRARALQHAMLSMIDDGAPADADPSHWAPFFVVGDGR
jgi:CHAT domain-containing protein/tetratricopeptide (TPR) repeat protein